MTRAHSTSLRRIGFGSGHQAGCTDAAVTPRGMHRVSTALTRLMGSFVNRDPSPSPSTVAIRHRPAFGVEVDPTARVLTLSGDMDMAAVGPFTVATASLTIGRRGDVTVDLLGLRFIDASGLGAFVALHNILRRGGQQLHMRNASARTARIFDLGGLSPLLATSA